MILLVNTICSSLKVLDLDKSTLGSLLTPRSLDSVEDIVHFGIPYAADNDAFKCFNEERYLDMLKRISGWDAPPPLFVTMPDVLTDRRATESLARTWAPILRNEYKLPAAFVLQDGQSLDETPWNLADAVFIGGSTEYKLGHEARIITAEAKQRGLWVHMGRVNSRKRIRYAHSIGCDSVDGSGFSMFRNTHLPWATALLSELGDSNCTQLNLEI